MRASLPKQIAVLGGGESGIGAALLAAHRGVGVFLSEGKSLGPGYRAELEAAGVPFEEGQHSLEQLLRAEAVVKSPGIPPSHPAVVALKKAGVPIWSDVEWFYRNCPARAKIAAITGSNGKTTTKELIHAVLSSTYRTYTTKGNLNNHIGIPLTILSIGLDAEMAIIEMGANHQKEIEGYCRIALPTHGLITNCGKAHMEGFGGVMGIRKGKGELYDHLALTSGTVFVNSDLDYLMEMSVRIPNKIYYGNNKGNFNAAVLKAEPLLSVEVSRLDWGLHHLHTNLVGAYNLPNIEAAICIGDYFEIPFIKIAQAIATYIPDNARSQLIKKSNNQIVLDAYNANPSSMQVAIENFARQSAENKYVFLGAMMELGEDSVKEHQDIADLLASIGLKNVFLVGGDFEKINHPFRFFSNVEEAVEWLAANRPSDALILIKGSRSTRMEKLMEVL